MFVEQSFLNRGLERFRARSDEEVFPLTSTDWESHPIRVMIDGLYDFPHFLLIALRDVLDEGYLSLLDCARRTVTLRH